MMKPAQVKQEAIQMLRDGADWNKVAKLLSKLGITRRHALQMITVMAFELEGNK